MTKKERRAYDDAVALRRWKHRAIANAEIFPFVVGFEPSGMGYYRLSCWRNVVPIFEEYKTFGLAVAAAKKKLAWLFRALKQKKKIFIAARSAIEHRQSVKYGDLFKP